MRIPATLPAALACVGTAVLVGELAWLLGVSIRPRPPATDGDYRPLVFGYLVVQLAIAAVGTVGALRGRTPWSGFAGLLLVFTTLPFFLTAGLSAPPWVVLLVVLPPALMVVSAVTAAWMDRSRHAPDP